MPVAHIIIPQLYGITVSRQHLSSLRVYKSQLASQLHAIDTVITYKVYATVNQPPTKRTTGCINQPAMPLLLYRSTSVQKR